MLATYSGRLLGGMPNGVLSLAYTLARMGEHPLKAVPSELASQSGQALHCLSELGHMDGGWSREGFSDGSECLTTCWAITALENSGLPVPLEGYAFVRACERWDGSFAVSPADRQHRSSMATALATTVTAVRVLREISPRTEEYLLHALSHGESARNGSYVCAEVLDWVPGLASWQLLNSVSRLTASLLAEDPAELANLLRCLVRLRLQRSWAVSAQLRGLQQTNGAWISSAGIFSSGSGTDETPAQLKAALATAAAVSSLFMAEAQPGLYFGSDLPARRFSQGWAR
jgi:hypothetical protein